MLCPVFMNIDNQLLEKMLDLPEFKVTDLKHNEHDIRFFIEKKEKPYYCPDCGVVNPKLRVHSSSSPEIRDKNILDKRVGLVFKRRRYKCMECLKVFTEPSDAIPERARLTTRLREYIAEQSKTRSFTELSKELDISTVTIRDIFLEEMENLPVYQQLETPSILGIDEIHISREKKHRKQAWAVICNGEQRTVMEFLPNRNKKTIVDYLKNLKEPANVKVVTMDMWKYYKEAVYEALPNAVVVVDKFHVVKLANEALNTYRKSLKKALPKKANLKLKKDRWVLLSRPAKLKAIDLFNRDAWFGDHPLLKTAYELKEELFEMYDCKTRSQALLHFNNWKAKIPNDLPDFQTLASTIESWAIEIFNYFDYPYTNAFVEGINSTIRYIEKQGRGYSFDVLRAKIIYGINHKVERPLKPKYGTTIMHHMVYSNDFFVDDATEYEYGAPEDYGVSFDDIIKSFK